MKSIIKKIANAVMLSVLFTFAMTNYVHADLVDPGYIGGGIDDVSNRSLLKIIIILLTIILLMGIAIIKYLYSKYSVELKIVKKDEGHLNTNDGNNVYTYAANTTGSYNEGSNNENNAEQPVQGPSSTDGSDNVKIELDMKKMFAAMLLIVALLIVVGIIF